VAHQHHLCVCVSLVVTLNPTNLPLESFKFLMLLDVLGTPAPTLGPTTMVQTRNPNCLVDFKCDKYPILRLNQGLRSTVQILHSSLK
jgi:hypothetical protein